MSALEEITESLRRLGFDEVQATGVAHRHINIVVEDLKKRVNQNLIPKSYPKGALFGVGDLIKYKNQLCYKASKKFCCSPKEMRLTGRFGVGHPEWTEDFAWYEFKDQNNIKVLSSLHDHHIINQSYNDWYIFHNIEDARRYLNLCPCCGQRKEKEK